MLALILWWAVGWRWGLGEVLAELSIGALFLGGGGGRRFLRALRAFWPRPLLHLAKRPV